MAGSQRDSGKFPAGVRQISGRSLAVLWRASCGSLAGGLPAVCQAPAS